MNKELLLGDFKNESAIEMNIINETLLSIGRILGLSSIILILLNFESDSIYVFRIILVITSFWKVIALFGQLKLKEKLRR